MLPWKEARTLGSLRKSSGDAGVSPLSVCEETENPSLLKKIRGLNSRIWAVRFRKPDIVSVSWFCVNCEKLSAVMTRLVILLLMASRISRDNWEVTSVK